MSKELKVLLLALASAFVAGFIASFLFGTVIVMVLSAVIGLTVFFVMQASKSSDSESESTDETEDPAVQATEHLLNANLELRKSHIPADVLSLYENIIDDLIAILPRIHKELPDGEMAWIITRMATEYLPEKSIKPYLALDDEARFTEKAITSVTDSLAAMQSELEEIESMLETKNQNEFNTKALFLKRRFDI